MATRNGTSGDDVLDAAAFGELAEINIYRGAGGDDTLTGGALTDTLIGGEGSDRLFGGDGADALIDRGVGGSDRLDGDAGEDTIEARYGADTLSGGAGDDSITFGFGAMLVKGGRSDDLFYSIGDAASTATVLGGSGDDVLRAGASSDLFSGGQGEDLVDYSATSAAVIVNLATGLGGGAAAGDSYDLVEDVTGGKGNDVLIGDGAYNVLRGGAGDDTIAGGVGADYLDGGAGFDVVDLGAGATAGVVADLANGSLFGDSLRNLEGLIGSAFADALTGDDGANRLMGLDSNDSLNGEAGDDTLSGDDGQDHLRGRDGADLLQGGSGFDTLAGGIGADSLVGGEGDDNLDGGTDADSLTGGEGRDLLDGGESADTMLGGGVDDIYVVDDLGDVVIEATGGGVDAVRATVNYALTDNFENLVLVGPGALQGVGNALANGMTGNDEDNVLDGGASADTMRGGLGDDTYYVDDSGDVVFEADEDGSFDEIVTSADLNTTLQPIGDVERITLAGDEDLRIAVRFYDGEVVGNAGDNFFSSFGGGTLTGGEGADTFYYPGANNNDFGFQDFITDFTPGEDTIQLAGERWRLPAGELDPDLFQIGGFEPEGAARLIYRPENGALLGVARNGDVKLITVLSNMPDLTADDFTII